MNPCLQNKVHKFVAAFERQENSFENVLGVKANAQERIIIFCEKCAMVVKEKPLLISN